MDIFRKVANHEKVHLTGDIIKELSIKDLQVYAYIRIIACLDEVFQNICYKNDDYVNSKTQ
jgi:hypothetical protein